jgi:hypothetical protein
MWIRRERRVGSSSPRRVCCVKYELSQTHRTLVSRQAGRPCQYTPRYELDLIGLIAVLSAVRPVGCHHSEEHVMTTVISTGVQITVGVDTHADAHVAAALDQLGRLLET